MKFQGMSTSEVIGAHNEWFLMIMMANDILEWMKPKVSNICLTDEEKP